MSIDKSLRRKNSLERTRNVLKRGERILQLKTEDRWPEGRSPFGLPKVKVIKIVKKVAKKKEEKAEDAAARPVAGRSLEQGDPGPPRKGTAEGALRTWAPW